MDPTPEPKLLRTYEWDEARGLYREFHGAGVLVVRPWPRPAAWVFVRRRTKERPRFRARVPREAWENDDPPPVESIPPSIDERIEEYEAPFHAGLLDWADYDYMDLVDMQCDASPEQVHQENEERAASYPAWRTVPPDVRSTALRLAPYSPWATLRAIGAAPELMTLGGSVPWLAWALINHRRVRARRLARPYHAMRRLLRRPDGMARWRSLAGWLGFDRSAALVNVLRRTSITRGWVGEHAASFSAALRAVWDSPEGRKRLLHARRIDEEVIRLVHAAVETGTARQLHPSLVDAAWTDGAHGGVAFYFRQVAAAWRFLEPRRPLPVLRTQEELDALRESLQRRVRGDEPTIGEFPPPPLPETAHVHALSSEAALLAEGATMQHCIGNGTWHERARRLEGYGYAVRIGEDRGSVWISRLSRIGAFRVGELRGWRNAPPSDAVVRAVNEWLAAHEREESALGALSVPEPWRSPPRVVDRSDVPPEIRSLFEEDLPF